MTGDDSPSLTLSTGCKWKVIGSVGTGNFANTYDHFACVG